MAISNQQLGIFALVIFAALAVYGLGYYANDLNPTMIADAKTSPEDVLRIDDNAEKIEWLIKENKKRWNENKAMRNNVTELYSLTDFDAVAIGELSKDIEDLQSTDKDVLQWITQQTLNPSGDTDSNTNTDSDSSTSNPVPVSSQIQVYADILKANKYEVKDGIWQIPKDSSTIVITSEGLPARKQVNAEILCPNYKKYPSSTADAQGHLIIGHFVTSELPEGEDCRIKLLYSGKVVQTNFKVVS